MDPSTLVALASLGMAAILALAQRFTKSFLDRDVEKERASLERVVFNIEGSTTSSFPRLDGPDSGNEESAHRGENAHFTELLISYYAHGLAQAKRSSAASLVSSSLGGIVLLVGVSMAIINATSNGPMYQSATVAAAGVLTNAIGVLFHRQANKALQHMEGQTQNLRKDMLSEREGGRALEQLEHINDPALMDQLRAALILRLGDASLPKLAVAQARAPAKRQSANGSTVVGQEI